MLRDLPIEGVAERLGLEVIRHKALCPFHNDHHPSLSFNVRRNTFRCFVCDAHGGTIDLVMKTLHKDFREACEWLSLTPLTPSPRGEGGADGQHACFDASRYERFFKRPWLSDAARRFLFVERRLDPRVVRWCRLTSWRDRQGVEWLQIPYYDREGKLIGIQNRNLDYSSKFKVQSSKFKVQDSKVVGRDSKFDIQNSKLEAPPRFRFPQGSQCGIYNLPVLNKLHEGEALYITEGCSDCWAMLSAGHKAIAIPSATLLKPKDVRLLETLNLELGTPFHMFPDRDAPGERLFLQLKALLPDLQHHQLPPDCKDYSDYYLKLKIEN